jgi:hypothetical protein
MKKLISAAALITGTLTALEAQAATYVVDRTIKGGTAVGSISTDDTIGVLTNDNITDFDITVNLQGFSRSFSKAKGWYNIVGNALSASNSTLSFDNQLPGNNYFYFQSDTYYFPGVYSIYSTLGGEGVQVYDRSVRGGQGGIVDFAQSAAAVPEPATWTAMIVGFAGIGAAMRRRKAAPVTTLTATA